VRPEPPARRQTPATRSQAARTRHLRRGQHSGWPAPARLEPSPIESAFAGAPREEGVDLPRRRRSCLPERASIRGALNTVAAERTAVCANTLYAAQKRHCHQKSDNVGLEQPNVKCADGSKFAASVVSRRRSESETTRHAASSARRERARRRKPPHWRELSSFARIPFQARRSGRSQPVDPSVLDLPRT